VRIELGQAMLQPGPSTTQGVGFKRAAESTDSVASSSKQARTGQQLIMQHIVSQHAMPQAAWDLAHFFTCNTAWLLVEQKNLVATFEPSERNWSLFGNIFSKAKNRVTLDRDPNLPSSVNPWDTTTSFWAWEQCSQAQCKQPGSLMGANL